MTKSYLSFLKIKMAIKAKTSHWIVISNNATFLQKSVFVD